jgi:hypothetical protein
MGAGFGSTIASLFKLGHLPIIDPDYPDKLVGFLVIHNIALTYDIHKKPIFGERELINVDQVLCRRGFQSRN